MAADRSASRALPASVNLGTGCHELNRDSAQRGLEHRGVVPLVYKQVRCTDALGTPSLPDAAAVELILYRAELCASGPSYRPCCPLDD